MSDIEFQQFLPKTWDFVEKYASRAGYKLNENQEILTVVVEGLARNKALHGHRYCPCRMLSGDPDEDRAKICPCKWHNAEVEQDGMCHCQLFFSKDA